MRVDRKVIGALVVGVLLVAAVSGCGARDEVSPITIGYLGGISGRSSGLGLAGRDGAQLAVEQVNASGGVNGREVVLVVADDAQGADGGAQGVRSLAASGAVAIVGPLTSVAADSAIPVANELRVPLLSPTVSSTDFSGKDDYFLRICADNRHYARSLAERAQAGGEGRLRFAAIYDAGNASYTARLVEHFSDAITEGGGTVAQPLAFVSGENPDYAKLARAATADDPAGVFVAANAIDSALVAQQLRKSGFAGMVLFAHWSVTDDLISNGGAAVEGALFMDNYDRTSQDPDYLAMRQDFTERFGYEPSFAAIHSYDAAKMLLSALGTAGEETSAKVALLQLGTYSGIQGDVTLDANGDTDRPFYPMTIRDGSFVPAGAQ